MIVWLTLCSSMPWKEREEKKARETEKGEKDKTRK